MSLIRTTVLGQPDTNSPVSPYTFVAIADEALASGDAATAVRFVEMAYQAFDEIHAGRWTNALSSATEPESVS